MKRRIYLGTLLVCLIAALIWFFFQRSLQSSLHGQVETVKSNKPISTEINHQDVAKSDTLVQGSSPLTTGPNHSQAQIEQRKQEITNTLLLWRTPLLYYGKVVDENNQPIAGVRVSYGGNALDVSLTKETRNEGAVITDQRGIFKIDGLYGIGLMLQLSHPDYYPYPDNSTGFDVRSPPRDGTVENSELNARTFRMHSKGHPVPLVHRSTGVDVPLDRNPKTLSLRGADGLQQIGRLVIQATGTPPERYDRQPFDWDIKITAPDGGFIEYTNQFDFIAPDSGYQPSVEFAFQKDTVGWSDTVSKNYFVKLPTGYARVNFYIVAKSPLFFSVDYDYNPDGSANLERAK